MKNDLTELVFLLDRSGSMQHLTNDTIGGFNSMIKKQKREQGDTMVSTILFNQDIQIVHDRQPLSSIVTLTNDQYCAYGSTALFDSIVYSINHIDDAHKHTRQEDLPGKTLFIITTDGKENCSRKYTLPDVKELINKKTEQGWDFIFHGAKIDAIETAESMGIKRIHAANYIHTGLGEMTKFGVISDTISTYRKTHIIDDMWDAKLRPCNAETSYNCEYPFRMQNGIPVITVENSNFIIDTGSPVSFVFKKSDLNLTIKGLDLTLQVNPLGLNKKELDDYVAIDVCGLLGMDVLRRFGFITLDKNTSNMRFSSVSGENVSIVKLGNYLGVALILDVFINGGTAKAVLDTGAKIGYLNNHFASCGKFVGSVSDYAPSFGGTINTESYKVVINMANCESTCVLAKMTPLIESCVKLIGCESIIGLNDFEWSCLTIDFRKYKMLFSL